MRNFKQWGKRVTSLVLAASMMVSIASPVVVALEPTDEHYTTLLAAAALLDEYGHDHSHDAMDEENGADVDPDAGVSAVSADDYGIETYGLGCFGHIGINATKISVVEATCTEPTKTTYRCKNCGEEYVVTGVLPGGHEYDKTQEPAEYKAATCEEAGYKAWKCTNCDHVGDWEAIVTGGYETIDKLGHSYDNTQEPVEYKEATCEEAGYKAWKCTREGCDHVATSNESKGYEKLEAAGHSKIDGDEPYKVEAATCKNEGKAYYHCVNCEGDYVETLEIDPDNHTWDEGKVTTKPTCTEKGIKTYSCTNKSGPISTFSGCKATYTEEINADGHKFDYVQTTAPTCENEGVETWMCTVCGETNDPDAEKNADYEGATRTVGPKGHDWNTGTVSKAPTCTEAGEMTYTCLREKCVDADGNPTTKVVTYEDAETEAEKEALKPTGHDWVLDEGNCVAPTCTENGVNAYKCDNGDCTATKTVTYDTAENAEEKAALKATGHTLPEEKTEDESKYVAPTCTEKGKRYYYCKDYETCGGYVVEEIPANGHTVEIVPGKDATCYEPGLGVGSKCSVCGKLLVAQAQTRPVAHTQSEDFHVFKAATCTEAGYEAKYCTKCLKNGKGYVPVVINAETDENVIQASGNAHDLGEEVVVEPTCEEAGYTYQYCSNCKQNIKVEGSDVEALGHDWSEWSPAAQYACVSVEQTRYCQRACCTGEDGSHLKVETRTTTAADHTPKDNWEVKTAATCYADGEEVLYCKTCGNQINTRKIDSKTVEHTWTEWTQTTAPTCFEKGEETRYCTVCKEHGVNTSETRDVASYNAHSFTNYVDDGQPACCEQTATAKCDRCDATDNKVTGPATENHKFTKYEKTKVKEDSIFGQVEVTRYIASCDNNCGATKSKNVAEYEVWKGQKALADEAYKPLIKAEELLAKAKENPYSVKQDDVTAVETELKTLNTVLSSDAINGVALGEWKDDILTRKAAVEAGVAELKEYIKINQTIYDASDALKNAQEAYDKLDAATVTTKALTDAKLATLIDTAETNVKNVTDATKKAEFEAQLAELKAGYAALLVAAYVNEADTAIAAAEAALAALDKDTVTSEQVTALNEKVNEAQTALALVTDETKYDELNSRLTIVSQGAMNMATSANNNALAQAKAAAEEAVDAALAKYNALSTETVTTDDVNELNKLMTTANKKLETLGSLQVDDAGEAYGELLLKLDPATKGVDALEKAAACNDAVAALAAAQAEYDKLESKDINFNAGFTTAFDTFNSLMDKAEEAIKNVTDKAQNTELTDRYNALQAKADKLYDDTQAANLLKYVAAAQADLAAQQEKLAAGELNQGTIEGLVGDLTDNKSGNYYLATLEIKALKTNALIPGNKTNSHIEKAEADLAAVELGYKALNTALANQKKLQDAQTTVKQVEDDYKALLEQNITDDKDPRITAFGDQLKNAKATVDALPDSNTDVDDGKKDGTILPDGTTKKDLQDRLEAVAKELDGIAGETLYNNAKAKVEAAVKAYNTLTETALDEVVQDDVKAAQALVTEANAAISLVTNADRKAELEKAMEAISSDNLTDLYNYTVAVAKIATAKSEYDDLLAKVKDTEDGGKDYSGLTQSGWDSIWGAISGSKPFTAYEKASKAAYEAIEDVTNGHDALKARMDAIEEDVAALKQAVEDYENKKDEESQAKKLKEATEAVEAVENDLKALQDKLVAGTLTTSDLLTSATIYVDIGIAEAKMLTLDKSDAKTALQKRLTAATEGAAALSGALTNQAAIKAAEALVEAAEKQYNEIKDNLENIEDISDLNTAGIIALCDTAEASVKLLPDPNKDTDAGKLDGTILPDGTSKTTLEARLKAVRDGIAPLTDAYYINIAEPLVAEAEKQLKALQDKKEAGTLSDLELSAGLTALKLAYSTAEAAVEKISENNETRKAMDERMEAVAKGIEALEAATDVVAAKYAVKLAVAMYNEIIEEDVSETLLNQLVELYDAAKEKVDALEDSEDKTELQNELAKIADGIEALREQLAINKATELVESAEKAVDAVDTSASTVVFVAAMTSAQDKYDEAKDAVAELKDGEAKTALEERLKAVSKQISSKWGEFIKNELNDLWDEIKNGELSTEELETLKKALEDLKKLGDIPVIGGIVGDAIDVDTIDALIAMVDVAIGSANLFNDTKKVISKLFEEIKAGDVTSETLNEAKQLLSDLGDLIKNTITNDALQNMAKKLFDQLTNAIEEAAAQAAIKVLQAIINDNTYDGFADAYHAVIDALNKLPDGSFKDGLIEDLTKLKDQIKDAVTQQLNAILLDDTLSFEEKDARISQIEEEYDDFFQYIGLSGEFDKLIATIRTQLARLYINALKGIIANMADQNEIDAAYEAAVKAIEVLGKYGFVDTEALLKELLEVLKEDIYDNLMEELNQILYDDVATYEEKIQQLKEYAAKHADIFEKLGGLIDIDGWIQTILNEEMVKIIQNAIKEISDIVGNDEMDPLDKIDALNALKNKIHSQIKGEVAEDVGAWLDKFDKAIDDAIDSIAAAAGWATDKILDAALTEVNKAVQESESKEELMAKINKIYDDAHALLVKLGQTEEQATNALKDLKDVIDAIEEALYYEKIDFISWKTLQNTLDTLVDGIINSDEPASFVIKVVSDILKGNSGNLDNDGIVFALGMVRDLLEDADWEKICHNLIDDAMNEVVDQIEDSQYSKYQIVQDLMDQLMDEMGDLAKADLDEETIQKISKIFIDMLNNAIENVENGADYETVMSKAREDLSGLSKTITGEITRIGGDASSLLGDKLADVINGYIPGGFLTNWIGNLIGGVGEWVANYEINKYNKEFGNTITSYVKRYTCWKHNAVLTTVTEATCESEGLQVYQCHNCDWIEEKMGQVVIPALGHIEVKDAAVEPTQTTYGYTEGSHCARCGKAIVAQQIISMLDPEIDTAFDRAEISAKNLEAAGFASEAELKAAVEAALAEAGYTTANSEWFQIRVNSSIGALPSDRFPASGVTGTLPLPSQTAGKMAQTYYAVQVFTADTIGHKAGDIVVTPVKLLNGGKNGMQLTVYTEAIVVIAWKAAQ